MWIIILVVVALAAFFVMTYNALIAMIEAVRNNKKQIDIQLDRRFKVFESLINVVKKYMDYEKTTLKDVVALRNQAQTAQAAGDEKVRMEAENKISQLAGGLNVVFKALLEAGDEVLALTPYFVEYGAYVQNHGGRLTLAETTAEFQPDLDSIEASLSEQTKILIINSPNNPTGAVYSQQTLDELAQLLLRKEKEYGHPIYLVSDDIYRYLVFDGLTNSNVFLSYPNSILVNSHSKDLGLAGERIGYIAVHPDAVEGGELRQALVLCNRILGFVNAPAMMQKILPLLGNARVDISVYEKSRDKIFSMISELGFEAIKPQGAFYIFPKSPDPDDVSFVKRAQHEKILLVPGVGFGGPGHFRISLCCSAETIENSRPGFKRLAEYYGL